VSNDPYSITTIVKPGATNSQILSSCNELEYKCNSDDVVFLAIGMNDKNPYLLFSELGIALYKLRHTKVYIMCSV
jgi:hypothetical protein